MEYLNRLLLDLEKSVQCAICLQSLTNPVTTKCDHNFCNLCISKAFKGKYQIPCPLCKKIIKNRSLKKADYLRSLIPLVHQVTNQVQERADIPYTLSQSTRPKTTKKVGDSASISHPSPADQPEVTCNGEAVCSGESTITASSNMTDQAPQDTAAAVIKDLESADKLESSPDVIQGEASSIVRKGIAEPCDHEMIEASTGAVDGDSHNIVAKVTISADVHRSPLREIEGSAELLSQKNVPNLDNATLVPIVRPNDTITNTTVDIPLDPYDFPVSQKTAQPKKVAKKVKKRKSVGTNMKKRKSSSDYERRTLKRRKRSPRPLSDAEVQRTMAQRMIDEVENHSLTVQNVTGGETKVSKPKNKLVKKTPPSGNKKPKARSPQHSGGENPILMRRLLSDSTSESSDSENYEVKGILPKRDASQQSVNDKVQNWLQTASPSATSDSGTGKPSPSQKEILEMSDDDISHSQISVERLPDRVIVLKRRKFSSPLKLDPKLQESVRNQLWSREVAVFGSPKPIKTFLPKIRQDVNFALRLTDPEKRIAPQKSHKGEKAVIIGRQEQYKVRDPGELKDPELENIFDIPGLSQGVSPFGTPEENETTFQNTQPTSLELKDSETPSKEVARNETSVGKSHLKTNPPLGQRDKVSTLPLKKRREPKQSAELFSKPEESSANEKTLKEIVNDLSSPGNENYEIEEPNTEEVANFEIPVPTRINQKVQLNDADKITSLEMEKKEDVNKPQSSVPKAKESDGIQSKKHSRGTPTRKSLNSKLPSLGASPSAFPSSKQSLRKKSASALAPAVELGLLDFSEPMHLPEKSGTAVVARTDAVAETCRMVMESFDKMNKVEEAPGTMKKRRGSAENAKNAHIRSTSLAVGNNHEGDATYDTDDSMIPPSTSTANLDLPETPPKCNLEHPPNTVESVREGTEDLTQSIDVTPEKQLPILTEVVSPSRNIIKNAPLPGETEFSAVERQVIDDVTEPGDSGGILESSENSDAEHSGSLRCLTNGWGGTKLRIFRSTGSDTDSNFSELPSKKKKAQKAKKNGKQDLSASDHLENATSALPENDQVKADADSAGNNIVKSGTCLVSSTDVIPNSEKISENASGTQNAAPVRKSSRKNKGCHTSFDFEMNVYQKKKKKETTEGEEKRNEGAARKKASSDSKTQDDNVVLQHLRNALAEIDDNKKSKDEIPENSAKEVKSVTKPGGKLTKIHPKKKHPVTSQPRLQTGKRTKKSSLSEEATQMHSFGGEKQNFSWPIEDKQPQTTFVCSQPAELPKHITDVSVRVMKLGMVSPAYSTCSMQLNEDQYRIDSSPMLFATQNGGATDLNRQQNTEKRQGRSISIDLSKPVKGTDTAAVLNPDQDEDAEEFLREDTDDVICCSWNDEEKMESVTASCHEEECSVASGQPFSRPSTPKKQNDTDKTKLIPEQFETLTEDLHLRDVISTLKKLSSINQASFINLIPHSMTSLKQAIDLCIVAHTAIESELIAKKDDESKFRKASQRKGHSLRNSENENPRAMNGGREVTMKQKSTCSSTKSKTAPASETPKGNLGAYGKAKAPVKRDPSPGETPSTSGLNFRAKSTAIMQQRKALEYGDKNREPNDSHELQDYFNETDDMALFGDPETEQNTNGVDANVPTGQKSQTEESVEHAMTEIQPTVNGLLDEKREQLSEEMETGDVIAATQESCEPDDVDATDVVASNVDSWLKRLSDLNKKKGEIQKRKIGDKWRLSPRSPVPTDKNSEKVQNETDEGNSTEQQQEPHQIDENLHGVTSADVVQSEQKDITRSKTSLGADSLHLLPSPKHGTITPDQLPQLSVVVKRTPIRELQAKLLAAKNGVSTEGGAPGGGGTAGHDSVKENTESRAVGEGYSAGIREWLDSKRHRTRSQSPEELSPSEKRMGIVTSGLQEKEVKLVKIFASRLNGDYYPTFDRNKVTHVVVRGSQQQSCDRTLKYLQGISGRKWVIDFKWVVDYFTEDVLQPEDKYEIVADNCMRELESEDSQMPQGPMRSRKSAPDFQLLSGYRCVCLPPYHLITAEQTSELLDMCGATVVSHLGELIRSDAVTSDKSEKRLIIVDVEATTDVPDYTALGEKFGATVVNIEWVYESISRFEAQLLENFEITGFTQDSETHF